MAGCLEAGGLGVIFLTGVLALLELDFFGAGAALAGCLGVRGGLATFFLVEVGLDGGVAFLLGGAFLGLLAGDFEDDCLGVVARSGVLGDFCCPIALLETTASPRTIARDSIPIRVDVLMCRHSVEASFL